jgi:hypothetical protein
MKFAIYPSIGFARLGNSPDGFFIGAEGADGGAVEIAPDGGETPVASFKDDGFRMKRQGARFHLFEVAADGSRGPAVLPPGSTVSWSVRLANKKDAIRRPPSPPDSPRAVRMDPARADRHIVAEATVEGMSAAARPLDGTYRAETVNLGEIRTDARGRLIVLGGRGRSETLSTPPAPLGGSFYNNPDWFDDVGDGPVTARVTIPGEDPVEADPAWVIVGPPDFAPPSRGVVTLHDVIRQTAIAAGWSSARQRPRFETDIRPMIERARNLRWVHNGSAWGRISADWARLSSAAAGDRQLRADTAMLVREVESALQQFELQEWQLDALDAWIAGDFDPGAAPDRGDCDALIRAALDGTVGQGFFPGIEAGVNITDPSIYRTDPFEFRLDPRLVQPGDLTAHMALPWQADFLKCASGWWPAQRPDFAPQASGPARPWLRPTMDPRGLVDNALKLGVITGTAGGEAVEQGRHPSLGS